MKSKKTKHQLVETRGLAPCQIIRIPCFVFSLCYPRKLPFLSMWHFFTPFYYKSLKHCFGYCDYVFITKRILIKDSCYLSTFSCCCNYILVDLKVSFLPISSQNCVIHSLWSDSHMKWFQTFSLTLFRLIQIISAWFNLFPLIVASEMSNMPRKWFSIFRSTIENFKKRFCETVDKAGHQVSLELG